MKEFHESLRQVYRLKENCDYAVTKKFSEVHLLCHTVFLPQIKKTADQHGIIFSTIHTYT